MWPAAPLYLGCWVQTWTLLTVSSVKYEEEPVEPAGLVRPLCDNRREEEEVCIPALNPVSAHRPAPECVREFRLSGEAAVFAETH